MYYPAKVLESETKPSSFYNYIFRGYIQDTLQRPYVKVNFVKKKNKSQEAFGKKPCISVLLRFITAQLKHYHEYLIYFHPSLE